MAPQQTWMRSSRLVPLVAVIVGIAAVAFVLFQASDKEEAAKQQSDHGFAAVEQSEWEHRDPEDPMALGDVDAPVGLVVFSDFQCQYCAKWSHETLPELLKYVDDGKLRIEFREMNIFGAESEQAARAAYSAGLQGKLREYHALLFPEGKHRPKNQLNDDALADLASQAGLDVERFKTDYGSRRVLSAIRDKASDGFTAGTVSTPAFILANQPILGAQPTSVFTDKIDSVLDASGN
ncbi:MAG: thioredoxin domain-containing protein [Gordonia sp. (in: high G+C Gram-positive bacteria)]|uniref:DsbA family protein n=2 Tax=Gordonia sp. (in: high G+C Gram-positive bacteria) TaxID=84139 RepID=UPI003C738E0A